MEHEYWYQRLDLAEKTSAPVGVGAFLEGNILLIGEQASDPTNAPEQQPFCSSKGCSGWINKLLESEQIPEDKLFWINALYNDGTPVDLRSLIEQLKPSAVIALGNTAKKQCHEYGISYHGAYHPQYWKRFRSKQRYPLLDLLKFLMINVPERNLVIGYINRNMVPSGSIFHN